MEEQKVGRLDKAQRAELKALEGEGQHLQILGGEFRSKQIAFWEELKSKHTLPYGKAHYIKNGFIYTQVMK
ncbi:hypothetical protein LCGC14_1487540 [marine sediment metagenome]|uniref:Uncharacterized protein n=1 Tax=marine sediment metagenome TaxID=412755 RepID=A0A0F9J8G6_9ZZZZ